jgi:ferredoxin
LRITVDSGKCTGHARCYAIAPEIFELDESGYALPLDTELPAEHEALAETAAQACPEHAIRIG